MFVRLVIAAAAVLVSALAIRAEDTAILLGRAEFEAHCAMCHGTDAKGGGSFAQFLRVKPADLTKIAERHGGVFAFSDVVDVILMGSETPGHGPSKMPVWGDYFYANATQDGDADDLDAIEIVAGRVLSLAYYLESIQR